MASDPAEPLDLDRLRASHPLRARSLREPPDRLTAVTDLVLAEQDDTRHKTCFVAMPVTTPASYADDLRDPDHFTHVLTYLFTPALERAGYKVIPPKMLGATLIHAEIIRHLEQADLVLADLSSHNSNVFFELGIRTSLDRPVVLVKDKRSAAIPFDLGTINVLTYDESLARWRLDEEVEHLAEHVSNVPTDSDSGNAMWKYFGLTKRGGPAEAGSLEAKVNLLLAEVTKLRLAPAPARLGPDMPAAEKLDRFKRALRILVDNEAELDDFDVRPNPVTGTVDVILFGRLTDLVGHKIDDIGTAQGITVDQILEGPLLPET
jgi:hypothetical protein